MQTGTKATLTLKDGSFVAIFDGVTSIQTFNLVPEPYDYTTDDTVIHDNPEPEVTA